MAIPAGWVVTNLGAVADSLAEAYGVALATVGIFVTAQVATHAALQIPAGRIVDLVGGRRTGLLGLSLLLLASALGALAPDAGLALVARAVTGVGSALAFLAGSDMLRVERRSPLAQGIYGGLAMAGAGCALAVLPLAEPALGWRVAWLSAALVAVPPLVALGLSQQAVGIVRAAQSGHRSVVGDRRLYPLALLYTATYGSNVLVGSWVVTYLLRDDAFSTAQAALAGALVLATGIVARPLGGAVAARSPARVQALLGACLAAGALATVLLVLRPPFAATVVVTIVIGLAAGIPFGPLFSSAQRLRPDRPATAVGFVNGIANVVVVVGIPLVGVTFGAAGDGRIGFGAIAGLWCLGLALLPTAGDLNVSEPRGV